MKEPITGEQTVATERRRRERGGEPPDPTTIERERLLARRATARLVTAGLLCLFAVIVALIVVVLAFRDTGRTNGERIDSLTEQVDDLTVQLDAARVQIASADAEQVVRDACAARFQAVTRTASRETSAGIARLVIIISTTPIADREAAIGDGVAHLSDALSAYEQSTNAQNAWQTLPVDQQLPCPL